MKINVITVCYNESIFIEYQYKLLKKFLQNDFSFYIYDNSPDDFNISNDIKTICEKHNLNYTRIPQQKIRGDASVEAGRSLDFAIDHNIQNFYSDYGLILDSDMFLVKPLNFMNRINSDFVGVKQVRDHVFYYNNQLCFLNFKKLIDFDKCKKFYPGAIDSIMCDCGGYLYYYFTKNTNITHSGFEKIICSGTITDRDIDNKGFIKKIDLVEFINNDEKLKNFYKREIEISYLNGTKNPITGPKSNYGVSEGTAFSEIFDETFLHFRAGSNWIGHTEKTRIERKQNLFNYFDSIL